MCKYKRLGNLLGIMRDREFGGSLKIREGNFFCLHE